MSDWKAAKQLLRYLKGTINYGIKYHREDKSGLISYSDSDYAGDMETAKSTTGYVLLFNGSPFHWKTQKQRHVTLSSTEAEVIALCSLSKELFWIRRMMIDLRIINNAPAIIRCDNQSAMKIIRSEKATSRTRHLRAQDAFVRELINEGEFILQHVKSAQQLADLLTKVVATGQFVLNRDQLLCTVERERERGRRGGSHSCRPARSCWTAPATRERSADSRPQPNKIKSAAQESQYSPGRPRVNTKNL